MTTTDVQLEIIAQEEFANQEPAQIAPAPALHARPRNANKRLPPPMNVSTTNTNLILRHVPMTQLINVPLEITAVALQMYASKELPRFVPRLTTLAKMHQYAPRALEFALRSPTNPTVSIAKPESFDH